MPRRVLQRELDRPFLVIDQQPPLFRKVHRRLVGACGVGQEHVAPPAARHLIADVDHAIGKLVEEHAWLDVAFCLRGDDAERDLAECLVAVRQRDDRDVRVGGGGGGGQNGHRAEQSQEADAARLERDEFTIARQPAEPDEDADEQRHRDIDAEGLRQQRDEHLDHRRPVDAFLDELFALFEDDRDLENEAEEHHTEEEGQQYFADEIAIEYFEHRSD
jgi:hypothetical protein